MIIFFERIFLIFISIRRKDWVLNVFLLNAAFLRFLLFLCRADIFETAGGSKIRIKLLGAFESKLKFFSRHFPVDLWGSKVLFYPKTLLLIFRTGEKSNLIQAYNFVCGKTSFRRNFLKKEKIWVAQEGLSSATVMLGKKRCGRKSWKTSRKKLL